MNAEELYQAIKDALNAFDLKWSEKDKMVVVPFMLGVKFEYGDKAYTAYVKNRKVCKSPVLSASYMWSRNPCPRKNERGHRGCSICDAHAAVIQEAHKHTYKQFGKEVSVKRCTICGKLK